MRSARAALAGMLCALLLPSQGAFPSPRVVASIAPIHSLVAGVMAGIGEPALIVKSYGSPHTYQMRPSDARNLSRADAVFWVGGSMEAFLQKPLASLPARARVIELMEIQELTLLEAREGGVWRRHEHGVPSDGHRVDPHIWLDPDNAARIVDAVARTLAEVDPQRAPVYQANGRRLQARLSSLDAELRDLLEPVQGVPYVVFHDAYQYFEKHYGLNGVGSVVVSPDHRPTARRISRLRAKIRELGARCVFNEPQFQSALVETLLEGSGASSGFLDPLGAAEPAGPDAFFRMMRSNATAMYECLSR